MNDDDEQAAMHAQAELEERQRREAEAIARCRPLQDWLRLTIEHIKHDRQERQSNKWI